MTERMEHCDACGDEIPVSVAGTLRNLVTIGFRGKRQTRLAIMYGGTAPEVLCWKCFATTTQTLNGVQT